MLVSKAATGGVLLNECSGNFAKFTGKQLCQSLFFNKVAGSGPATLLKRDSGAVVFLWILLNFLEHFFYRTTASVVWVNVKFLVLNEIHVQHEPAVFLTDQAVKLHLIYVKKIFLNMCCKVLKD